jgi:5'-nucleotidase
MPERSPALPTGRPEGLGTPPAPRRPRLQVALAIVAAAVGLAACATGSDAPVPVRLLAFNDFHGALEPTGLTLALPDPDRPGSTVRVAAGGAAFLASQLEQLRRGHANTVTVSSGDLIGASPLVSSLFRDEPTIEVMNAMRVDLNAVGNHEFDQGLAELRRLVEGGCHAKTDDAARASCTDPSRPYPGARFAPGPGRGFLAANVVDASGQPVFPPYQVRHFGGVRIGFIGVVTRSTPTIVAPAGVAGLRFLDEADTLNRYAGELAAQGVQALVAVVHEGGQTNGDWNDRRCPGARGPVFDIAARLDPQIDVIFSGHSHTGLNCEVGGRPLMQAFANGRGVSVVDLVLDARTGEVDRRRTVARNVPVVNTTNPPELADRFGAVPADPAVQRIVDRHAALAAPRAQRVVGRIAAAFNRVPEPDSAGDHALGRLIADAHLRATSAAERGAAQLAFTNPGGIRTDLACAAPPCALSFGQLFAVQPFGNSLVVMTLTGAQLQALLEQQASGVNAQRARMLQPSHGFTYRWNAAAPEGQRARDLRWQGRPVEPTARLRVTVNSFLAEGGDGFTVLRAGTDRTGGALDLDALVDALREAPGPVAPDPQPRVRPG